MSEEMIDSICDTLRSRLKALDGADYHIDIFVKDGKSYLVVVCDYPLIKTLEEN